MIKSHMNLQVDVLGNMFTSLRYWPILAQTYRIVERIIIIALGY